MNSKKAITLLVLATLIMGLIPVVSVNAITINAIAGNHVYNEIGRASCRERVFGLV